MTVELGLFDIQQIDPVDPTSHAEVYRRRLDHLALADELSLSAAFSAERHFMPLYRCPSGVAWLGAASQRTRNMRLGVLAFTLPIHDPVALAEEIAVLDHLSNGRLEVGLGLGHRVEELIALGVDPADRIELFQQRLAILQALWTGGQVTIESDYDIIREVVINPLPLQDPYPPLWYAGVNAQAGLWAGQAGLNLAVGFAPLRDLQPATAAFRAGIASREAVVAEPEGDASTQYRLALMRHVYVAESDDAAKSEMIEDLYRLNSLGVSDEGSRATRRETAIAEQERLVRQEIFVAGGPDSVATSISFAVKALSVDLFLANVYAAGIEDERVERCIRLLAGPVAENLAESKSGQTA